MSILFSKLRYFIFVLLLSGCADGIKPDSGSVRSSGDVTVSDEMQEEFNKAITAMDHNEFDVAEPLLVELTSDYPSLAGPWNNLGLIQYKRKDYTSAKESANKAIELKPDFAEAYNLIGMVEVQLGNIHEAMGHYREALNLNEKYPTAHYNIALLYDVYLQDIDNAIIHYIKYLELINDDDKPTRDWLEQLINQRKQGR